MIRVTSAWNCYRAFDHDLCVDLSKGQDVLIRNGSVLASIYIKSFFHGKV